MDYDEILDEDYLKALMEELRIDLPELDQESFNEPEDAFMIKTFTNHREAEFFAQLLRKAGFPVRMDIDPTFGSMDPLFNTGTILLKTREEYADQAYSLISNIQDKLEKDRPELRKRTPEALFQFTFFLIVATLVILFLLARVLL